MYTVSHILCVFMPSLSQYVCYVPTADFIFLTDVVHNNGVISLRISLPEIFNLEMEINFIFCS